MWIPLEQLLHRGRAPGHPVALRGQRVLDFGALRARAGGWARALTPYAGQPISLHLEDAFDFSAALLGAWHAGAIGVLPTDDRPDTLARLRGEVSAWIGAAPDGLTPLDVPPPAPEADLSALDPQVPAVELFTSGSSGAPVRIPKRLSQLSEEVRVLAATWDGRLGRHPVFATVSQQHIYGLLHRVLWPLASGRPFACARLPYAEDVRDALSAGPAILVSSPAHLKRLPPLDWAAARTQLVALFSSGGPLPDAALHDAKVHLGQAPVEVYGSSETGGIAWRQREDATATRWTPLAGVTLRVEAGNLQVRAPWLPTETWTPTSDRGQLVDGRLELQGRSDRLVKIEEKRVSLSGLERALLAGTWLEAARVVVLPGHRLTLGVVAVPSEKGLALLRREGKRALNLALRTLARGEVEVLALPRRFRYVTALPVNGQGKTTEAMLVEQFDPRRAPVQHLEQDARTARVVLEVRADCPFFAGHFPGAPILPGVTQLEWAIRLGRECFLLPPDFSGLEAVKFQRIIPPDTSLELTLDWAPERRKLSFRYTSADGVHASGRVLFSGGGAA